jgi:hypothetical protein
MPSGRSATFLFTLFVVLASSRQAYAQVTPAAGFVPPDDTPSIKVGVTIFADYTVQQKPKVVDADGNEVTLSAFNVARSYINVTGNISHLIAFRVTPDIAREAGAGSSLTGSQTFRLKYAYGQFILDDWLNKGSWVRVGMQQTPWVDFMESLWRYRFQGTILEDREGYLSSSDTGVSMRYNLPGNYGDIHGGFYNGETYARPEINDQKAFMVRGTLRPLRMHPILRGLRVTGFYDHDAYVKHAERKRAIGAVTFEHPHVNASFDYFTATDQARAAAASVDSSGFSAWITPKTLTGWEAVLRYDQLQPNEDVNGKRKRVIGGVAYWFPKQGTVSSAILVDVDETRSVGFATPVPTNRRFAAHMLFNWQ